MSRPIRISVISDVVCPWCYLGKRRFEKALAETGVPVELSWLPFELNPDMPPEGMARADYRARKFGAARAAELDAQMRERGEQEGVDFAFDKMTRTPNTRRAHALIALASEQGRGDAMAEELFRRYFEDGEDVGATEVLLAAASKVGLEETEARGAIDDEGRHQAVISLEKRAAQIGVGGVPFFIIEDKYAVSGAQTAENWAEILRNAVERLASGEA